MPVEICRFAPTASGRAHPGTLLAALLAWLDARSRGARFILRIEDIDRDRVTEEKCAALIDDLIWFGLDWDELVFQSALRANHEAALDRLAAAGRLYACSCSRSVIKQAAIPAADGGYVYPGTCRKRRVTDWRNCPENLRCDLSDAKITLADESGLDLSQNISAAMGDPLVWRADDANGIASAREARDGLERTGSATYQLAVVADDSASGVTRIVRGRDIAPSTATQAALYALLGNPLPVYRHHLLFLETRGAKFSKFHQAVGADVLRTTYAADSLCGILAHAAGIIAQPRPVSPSDLVKNFSWKHVRAEDVALDWDGKSLTRLQAR